MTEFREKLDRLLAEHGQSQFERALARWFFEAGRVHDYYKDLEKAQVAYARADVFFGGHFDYRPLDGAREGLDTCLRLGSVMLRRHRHPEAKYWYRKALSLQPHDRGLAEEVADVLLRHGADHEIREFIGAVSRSQPDAPLARHTSAVYRAFPDCVAEVKSVMEAAGAESDGTPAIVVMPLWGERYVEVFCDYALPILAAPGNLPSLARSHQATLVVFGSRQAIAELERNETFASLTRTMRFHPIIFDEELLRHADQQVAQYLLLSLTHYSALEAARQVDGTVFLAFPDNIVNEQFYSVAADKLHAGAGAVACAGFRLDMTDVLPAIEDIRTASPGRVTLSADEIVGLIMAHLGEQWFVDSKRFATSPFFLCWRVGNEGLLVRSTHFQPYAVRAGLLAKPLTLKIDPVDAQFMYRNFTDLDRIDCAVGSEMCCFDVGVSPNLDAPGSTTENVFRESDLVRFMQVYDTPLHRRYLRTAVRLDVQPASSSWDTTERESADMVERVFAQIDAIEAEEPPRPAWALAEDREFLAHG